MEWAFSTSSTERIRTLGDFDERVKERLRIIVGVQGAELYSRARAKLGGAVLGVRTGQTLASLKLRLFENQYHIGANVYSQWYIARFYEKGFGGKTVQVKVHTRLGHPVKAHTMKIARQQRPFLKPTLEEQRSAIRAALDAAVHGAAQGLA